MRGNDGTSPGTMKIGHATNLWHEGLPMGNGDLGLLMYGGPERVTLAVSQSDLWDRRVGPGQGPEAPAGSGGR